MVTLQNSDSSIQPLASMGDNTSNDDGFVTVTYKKKKKAANQKTDGIKTKNVTNHSNKAAVAKKPVHKKQPIQKRSVVDKSERSSVIENVMSVHLHIHTLSNLCRRTKTKMWQFS